MSEREYEIVLFGATGFTGSLTAEYLARHAPPGLRWAIAGRNRTKLEALRRDLIERAPGREHPQLIEADVSDARAIAALARAGRVVITTVGPYAEYGEPLVAACADAGTAYADLTGEPEFVDRMWFSYDQQARASGARLVHSCGFESIPFDLGALFTVTRLPEDVPIELESFGRMVGGLSGGTYQSAIGAMAHLRQAKQLARERRGREARPSGRRVTGRAGNVHNEPRAGGWVVPSPTIDPQHVLRSARALDRYGPDFTYTQYLVTGSLARALALVAAAGGAAALAQFAPAREMLRKLKPPGEGPSDEQRARSRFSVQFAARTAGRRLQVEVSGGDPGYGETSKMLAESALCLAFDQLPARAGQLTPATAMGERLIERLQRAGIRFEVIEEGSSRSAEVVEA